MSESENNEMQKLNVPEAPHRPDDESSVHTQDMNNDEAENNNNNNNNKDKEEMQKLRSLVLLNIAATTLVLLLLGAFLATYLIKDGQKDNTCDCECLYEFPPGTDMTTPAPTTTSNIFDKPGSSTDAPQEALEPNITGSSTLAPTIIPGRSVVSTNDDLRQAVKDAEAAGYDPSAEVFAEYGYPMGQWYVNPRASSRAVGICCTA